MHDLIQKWGSVELSLIGIPVLVSLATVNAYAQLIVSRVGRSDGILGKRLLFLDYLAQCFELGTFVDYLIFTNAYSPTLLQSFT